MPLMSEEEEVFDIVNNSPRPRLSPDEVRLIRTLYYERRQQMRWIAAHVGKTYWTVRRVVQWEEYLNSGGPGRPKDLAPSGHCRRCGVVRYGRSHLCDDCRWELSSSEENNNG